MSHYADRLEASVAELDCPVCVGIDPRPGMLPAEFAEGRESHEDRAAGVAAWAEQLLDVLAPMVPVVKPQIAFFEALGVPGVQAFADTVKAARERGLLVLADAKRGDIGSTAEAYATAHFDVFGADALTVNPYMGADTLEPFLAHCRSAGKGIYVLVRTSNPGAAAIQDLSVEGAMVHDRVAGIVHDLGKELVGELGTSLVGAVTGATHPQDLPRLRAAMPHASLLVPGFGAQGGGAEDCRPAFRADGAGAIVNSSRGITYAYRKGDHAARFGEARWKDSVRAAVEEMRDALNAVRR